MYGNYDYTNKKKNVNDYIRYMLARSVTMFEYNGLPDTIPQKNLELLLQSNGFCIVTEVNNSLYAFNGGLGGEGNVYFEPTQATITNPYLNYNKTLDINKNCVLMQNDYLMNSLLPIFNKYCYMLVENDITMVLSCINRRIQNLISANDDRTLTSANEYLNQVFNGKLGIIAENQLFDSLKSQNTGTNNNTHITDLIEYHQYLKASMYNEIGLNANFNMKKERLTSGEVEMNTENLYPLVDNMLMCRRESLNKINEMYNTNITVEFNSSWDYRIKQGEPLHTEDLENGTEQENNNQENNIISN